MPSEGVTLDLISHQECYLLVRKNFGFFLVESGFTCLAKFERGIVAVVKEFPKGAILYGVHTLALTRPPLNDAGRAETDWISRAISGGTRIALKKGQKYVRATEIAYVIVTIGSRTVCGLSQPAMVGAEFLFKHVVQKFDQSGNLLTKWVCGARGNIRNGVNPFVQGDSSLYECFVDGLLYAINFRPTNSARFRFDGVTGNSQEN